MELTRQEILNHRTLIDGLDGYLVMVQKAEEHVTSHPDIAIEACKSLIEGLCLKALSLVSDKYISTKSVRNKCKNNLTYLTRFTFENVYTNFVETKIHHSLSGLLVDVGKLNKFQQKAVTGLQVQTGELVSQISALRNERGDFSHGRVYPKILESSPVLAKSIVAITDGVCSFMIDELANVYQNKVSTAQKLVYEDLEVFNNWIDEIHQVTTLKIDFSKILYENAYDKYEELFYGDYAEQGEVVVYTAEWSESVVVVPSHQAKTDPVEIKYMNQHFDSEDFWSYDRFMVLKRFAGEWGFDPDHLIEILNNMYFTDRPPLKDDIANALFTKPSLLERAKVLSEKIKEVEWLAKTLLDVP